MALSTAIVEEGLMRVEEVARFLGLSRAKIYALMDHGDLVWAKIGRARRIPRRAVVELAARLVQGRTAREGDDRDA